MGTAPDQSVLEALRGYAIESLKHPTPRLVKIYISSTKQGKVDTENELSCLFKRAHWGLHPLIRRLSHSFQNSGKSGKCYSKSSDQNCNRFTMIDKSRFVLLRWNMFLRVKALTFICPQIEFVDMHFGTGLTHTTIDLDPYVLYDHLSEIRACYRASKSAFFIVS